VDQIAAGFEQFAHRRFQMVFHPTIVRIQEGDEFAATGADPGIARRRQPLVRLMALVANRLGNRLRKGAYKSLRAILRTVFGHDQFPILESLLAHGLQRLREVFLGPVSRDADTNKRHGRGMAKSLQGVHERKIAEVGPSVPQI